MIVGSCVPRLPLSVTICGGSLGLCTPTSQRSPLPLLEEELDEELLEDDEELLDDELELLLDELLLEDEELEELPPQAAVSMKLPEEFTTRVSIFARPELVVASNRMLFTPTLKLADMGVELVQVVQEPVAAKSTVITSTPLMINLPGRLPEAFA
jgi:hypothetical protein